MITFLLLLLLLQRSATVQVRSSVRLMPQKQPSGRGLLPSPTAWSPDQHPAAMLADVSAYRNFRTISRDFFPQLLTLRLKQRMRLIYGFFSIRGASHPRLFFASFQLASKCRAAIRTCLCSVLFISKVSPKFISIFKYSVEWSIHNNF